jgi:hypothetical protein
MTMLITTKLHPNGIGSFTSAVGPSAADQELLFDEVNQSHGTSPA